MIKKSSGTPISLYCLSEHYPKLLPKDILQKCREAAKILTSSSHGIEKAATILENVLSNIDKDIDPKGLGSLYLTTAILFLELGFYQKALGDVTIACQKDPTNSYYHCTRGNILQYLGQLDESLEEFEEAIKLYPNEGLYYLNRASVRCEKDSYEEAIDDTDICIGMVDTTKEALSRAYTIRGICHRKQKKFDDAIIDFNNAIKCNFQNAQAHFNMGIIFVAKKKLSEGLSQLTAALKLDPGNTLILYNRGMTFKKSQLFKEALLDFKECGKKIPADVDKSVFYYNYGLCHMALSAYYEAIEAFTKAIEYDSHEFKYRHERAKAYLQHRNFARAVQDLNEVIRIKPDFSNAYYTRGFAYKGLDMLDEAKADLKKAIELNPSNPRFNLNLERIDKLEYVPLVTPGEEIR